MAWPMPEVRHWIACQRFVADFAVRDISLLNVLYRVSVPAPPAGQSFGFIGREVHLLAQLSDGQGTFGLTVDLVYLNDEAVVARAGEVTVVLGDRLSVYNFHRVLRNVPFDRPGQYEFRLYARFLIVPDGAPVPTPAAVLLAVESLRIEVTG